jgi:hypothetical protein
MKSKRYPILACGVMILAMLACTLGAPAPTPEGQGQNILTLAAQTLQAQTPTADQGISVDQALTLAVGTLQAEATATNTIVPSNPPVIQPTNKPKKTKTPKPSDTPASPTVVPTTGTLHIHLPPIIKVTLVGPIQVVPVNPKLDYQASANYGEANLSGGFSPDPYSVGMTTGGNVDVSYLGGSCSGFATAHPDLRINFGGGGSSLLRIYFVGSNGDPAMVVNDPYGNFYCVDDSFGTVNPTIDFNNPAGGSYDVWIASYAANTTISGTLYITENSGNHP